MTTPTQPLTDVVVQFAEKSGGGGALSIGKNNLIHALPLNGEMQIALFNNRIYRLSEGKYSLISEVGNTTKSTPMGSIDHPIEPSYLALGSDVTFICRTMNLDNKLYRQIYSLLLLHH